MKSTSDTYALGVKLYIGSDIKNDDMPDNIIRSRIGIRLNNAVYPGCEKRQNALDE